SIKLIQSTAGDGRAFKRYRLTLSDSKNTFNSCILASQCNDLIDHNDLKDYSVIQLNNFTYHSQGPKSDSIIKHVTTDW
ncbi:unnamed protein product, partial [Didymodactylos carnosus]